MNKKIEVFEVGPRDGFQSVKCTPPIATDLKLEVIDRMADSLGTDWRDIAALFRGKIITIIPDGETGADEA